MIFCHLGQCCHRTRIEADGEQGRPRKSLVDSNFLVYDHDQEVKYPQIQQQSNRPFTKYFSSKDVKYVPSEQKILIESLVRYQARLEAVDAYDHVTLPPLYKQVAK